MAEAAEADHPARVAGLLSQKYVANGMRDEWLDLFAAEGCLVQDPVGVSPLVGLAGIRDRGFWHPCFVCLFRRSQRPPCCTLLVPQTIDRAMVEDHCQHGATRPKG